MLNRVSLFRIDPLFHFSKLTTCILSKFCSNQPPQQDLFKRVLNNNRKWAAEMVAKKPDYFSSLQDQQKPRYLWIGCCDSRVPANQVLGLDCGEVFVHRNVANLAPPSDINVMAAVQYAVETLKVKEILVAGHYGCGGIKAAFSNHDFGPLESWLCHVRDIRSQYKSQLFGPQQLQEKNLVELNVRKQVLNVARIAVVQRAWANNIQLRIHGVVYDIATGILKNTRISLSSIDHLPSQFRIQNVKST